MPVEAAALVSVFKADTKQADQAYDHMEQRTKKTQGIFEKLTGQMVGFIGANLTLGGLSAAWDGITHFFDGINQDAENLAQLNAVLQSTHDASGMTSQQVQDLAMQMRNLSGVDDAMVLSGEDMLLTFTNIGKDVFPLATQAMTNMSIAMNHGSIENLNLNDTAIQLGKALNDPINGITALSRVGVTFTDQQKAQIKAMVDAGDTAGAQKVILAELNREFGNSAKMAGDTLPAKINKMKLGWDDVHDSLATALAPIMEKVTGLLTNLFNFLSSHQEVLTAAAILIGVVLVAAFIAWAISAASAAVATIAATWPVLLIIAAVIALIAFVWILVANWDKIWNAIKATGENAWHAIVDGFNHVADFFTKTLPNAISSGFKTALNWAIDRINDFIGFLNNLHVDVGNVHIGLHIPKIPHLAKGGTVIRQGLVLVGEKGPELLRLPQGAQVQPLEHNGGSTGNTYNITVNDANVDERKLVAILKRQELLHR